MRSILNIAVHHAGGTQADYYASSLHMTPASISEAHRLRWNFPSKYIFDVATDGKPIGEAKPWYAGYNCIYDPKTRKFTQTRAIGEETAAQIGFNFNTFSLCIIGNYMIKPGSWPRASVDPLTAQIEQDVTMFLHDLIDGNKRGLFVAPDTMISLDVSRVHPHRFYQAGTDCYGTFPSDTYFRDLLITYKPVPVPPIDQRPTAISTSTVTLEQRNALIQSLLQLVAKLQDFILNWQKNNGGRLGSVGGRGCEGIIH